MVISAVPVTWRRRLRRRDRSKPWTTCPVLAIVCSKSAKTAVGSIAKRRYFRLSAELPKRAECDSEVMNVSSVFTAGLTLRYI